MVYGSCRLCGIIALSVRGHIFWLAVVVVAWIVVRTFLGMFKSFRGDLFGMLRKDTAAAAALALAFTFALDLAYKFQFALLMVILFCSGVIALFLAIRLFERTILEWGAPIPRFFMAFIVLFILMFLSITNLSALGGFARSGDVGYELKPSERASINSLGFRGKEFDTAKEDGVTRIVTMGDSAVYGYLIPERVTFSRLLERRLMRGRAEGAKFEVINAGVPAYNIEKTTARLKKRVLPLKPDVIVLVTGANDRTRLAERRYPALIGGFIRRARSGGARVVVCSYPFRGRSEWKNRVNAELKRAAERNGAVFIDLHAPVNTNMRCFLPDSHPNRAGHAVISIVLFRRLIELGVIPSRQIRGFALKRAGVSPAVPAGGEKVPEK